MQEKEKEKDKREEDKVRRQEVTWTTACLAEFKEDLNCKTKNDQKKKISKKEEKQLERKYSC